MVASRPSPGNPGNPTPPGGVSLNYPNMIQKDIMRAKRAIASVKAKPRIATLNNSCLKEGFLEIPIIRAPNTIPIPTPAPANPIAAAPPPIFFADSKSIDDSLIRGFRASKKKRIFILIKYRTTEGGAKRPYVGPSVSREGAQQKEGQKHLQGFHVEVKS